MVTPYFTDKASPPTDKSILAAVGRAAPAWRLLFDELGEEHPDLSQAWSYYADGKSWLLKVTRKSKTVFWVTVEEGGFRVAFYFPERLLGALLESELSEERKEEIRGGAPVGKLRPVSVKFGPQRGVRDVMALVSLKRTLR